MRLGALGGLVPLLLAVVAAEALAAPESATGPVELLPWLGIPPAFETRLVYYNGFSQPDGLPEVNRVSAEPRCRISVTPDGFLGPGALIATNEQALRLISPAFSPHRPVTFFLWWALAGQHQPESCFGILHLQGRGIVSHFSRGKGEWCALQKPAGVFQVYYFPGIQNVNGIYDFDLAAHLDLSPDAWHHTALVITAASLCELYTDGRLVFSVRIAGRPFEEADALQDLTFGSPFPMKIDEAAVFNRALSADEIAYYYTATWQMRQAGYR